MRVIRRLNVLVCLSIVAAMVAPISAEAQPGRRWYPYESSARIQVVPRHTEVYVDGYLAGTVDDFDGIAQRLRLPAGQHAIELYLDGHRTIRELLHFQPGETYRIRHTMEPQASGEAPSVRPSPQAAPAGTASVGATSAPPPGTYDPSGRGRRDQRDPQDPRDPRGRTMPGQTAGTLAIRVQPADATVLIDGERWDGSGGDAHLQVQVTPGPHRVEVQKEGYQPFTSTVHVRPGETTPLNVSLTPRP